MPARVLRRFQVCKNSLFTGSGQNPLMPGRVFQVYEKKNVSTVQQLYIPGIIRTRKDMGKTPTVGFSPLENSYIQKGAHSEGRV